MNTAYSAPTETGYPRRRAGWAWLLVSGLVLAACLVLALVALVIALRGPSELELAQRQAQLERLAAVNRAQLIGAVIWQWTWTLLRTIVPLLGVALAAFAALRRLSVIRADTAGGYPLLWLANVRINLPHRDAAGRRAPLVELRSRLVDPNRNPAMGVELGNQVTFIQPEDVGEAQMQVTTQAQLVQAERARASGTIQVNGGGRGRLAAQNGPTIIYPRALPEPGRAPIDEAQLAAAMSERDHIHEV